MFPLLISPRVPQLYALVTLALILHSSSTALIFLTMNSQFRKAYANVFFGRADSSAGMGGTKSQHNNSLGPSWHQNASAPTPIF